MANSSKKTSKSKGKGKAKGKTESFVWSDDEVELLLKVTQVYKVSQTSVKTDWESFEKFSLHSSSVTIPATKFSHHALVRPGRI